MFSKDLHGNRYPLSEINLIQCMIGWKCCLNIQRVPLCDFVLFVYSWKTKQKKQKKSIKLDTLRARKRLDIEKKKQQKNPGTI